jgi:hypothetical protein
MLKLFFILSLLYVDYVFAVSDQTKIANKLEVTATTTSTLALSGNTLRNYLIIQNRGTVSIYVALGSAHSGGQFFIEIIAGGNYEPFRVPREALYIKAATGTAAVTIIEGSQP